MVDGEYIRIKLILLSIAMFSLGVVIGLILK
jgi:hypothetical protein